MVWLGFGLIWAGYTVGLYGYSLVRGYNLTLGKMVSPTNWYSGKWPPEKAGNTVIIPTGTSSDIQTVAFTQANSAAGTPSGSGGGVVAGQSTGVNNTAAIRAAAAAHGWGSGGQWNSLTHLINAESGGSSTVTNSSSGALGIAQALGHGTATTGGTLGNEYGPVNGNWFGLSTKQMQEANSGNALQQARWMMGYIKQTYGTPSGAWGHELSNHWY